MVTLVILVILVILGNLVIFVNPGYASSPWVNLVMPSNLGYPSNP